MPRLTGAGCSVVVALVLSACSGSSTAPTATCQDRTAGNFGKALPCLYAAPAPAPAPPPAPTIAVADIQAADGGTTLCRSGYCESFTTTISNVGRGCARNVQVLVRWYGSDGAVPLPNVPDIPMGAPGGLSTYIFRPGTYAVITSLGGFTDVRSAHTVYRTVITWSNVAC